jgi:1,4-dihydroxy-2-naphthoate octaprenyltransferase
MAAMTAPLDLQRRTPELTPQDGLRKLAGYPFAILAFVDDQGDPLNVVVDAEIDPEAGTAVVVPPAGLTIPLGAQVGLTGSHIRPQPGYGYDQRRHVTVWGRLTPLPDGRLRLVAEAAWGWDETEISFFEYSERSVRQARKYFDALSAERGTPVRPRLSLPWLFLRTTRLPFLSATLVPVLTGIAIAIKDGAFDPLAALVTVVGAAAVHLGLNVTNDIFDTLQGADEANVTPTQYSGGSRVLQYGLVSLRGMALLASGCYALTVLVGLFLLATRGSLALLVIGVLGIIISVGYTAPPLKLVYRGLGELAVALGFGPLMLLGAYTVQTRGTLSPEALVASLPIGILVALILYVNEIPDRRADAHAGKRTLPVRWPARRVITAYAVAIVATYGILVAGVMGGLLPLSALLALITIPLAVRVYRGLAPAYDNPYDLMPVMAANVRLHLHTGLLLLAGYALVLLLGTVAPGISLYVT